MKKHFYPQPEEGLPSFPEGVKVSIGTHAGAGKKIGIVAARFNIHLTGAMVSSAVETLISQGVSAADIQVVWVAGSYEIPLMLKRLAAQQSSDALIGCGVVLEGETRHAELIMHAVTKTMAELSLELNCPVIDAVVSAYTMEQAEKRCLSGTVSRGSYAALTALECISVL